MRPITFFDKLVTSDVLVAVDFQKEETPKPPPGPAAARRFINDVAASESTRHPAVGPGETVLFDAASTTGAAPVHEGELVHISAFRKSEKGEPASTGFQRFSDRRGRMVD